MPAKPYAGYGLLAVSSGLESTRRTRILGQCVEIVSLIIYLQQLGHKFLGKSPWRLIGSGVTFYFPLARVRTDRPGRNPPSLHSVRARRRIPRKYYPDIPLPMASAL